MLSFCISHVATVVSPFRCSVFHFLAKLSKICEIFFSMKLSLLHKNVTISSHKKGNLMTLTAVDQFRVMTKSSQQNIISQAGTMKLGLS